MIEARSGISEADQHAVDELVCSKVRATEGGPAHRVRLAKLGSRVIVTLAPEGRPEKQVVLGSLDELPVAAPRLLESAREEKPFAETVDVTNVVGEETRTFKKKSNEVHGNVAMIGAGAIGLGPGGGLGAGLSIGSERWSFVGDGRLAVLSGQREKATYGLLTLGGGVRHHFSASDTSPFVGLGLALEIVSQTNDRREEDHSSKRTTGAERDAEGTFGLAPTVEVGLDLLRTHALGGTIVLRGDLPTFSVETTTTDQAGIAHRTATWAPIVSGAIALRF